MSLPQHLKPGLKPALIDEIEYRGWTSDGKLRHLSFKGLREIQDNAEVYRIGFDVLEDE